MDIPHKHVSYGMSRTTASVDESVRPCLCLAYPLPLTDDDERFRQVLEALSKVGSRQSDKDAPEGL